MLSPLAEVLAERLLKDGKSVDEVADVLYIKGFIGKPLVNALDELDRMAVKLKLACSRCGSMVDLHTEGKWAGICHCCVETNSQSALEDGKCLYCSSDVEFLGEDENEQKQYMCSECGSRFHKFAGWWYV